MKITSRMKGAVRIVEQPVRGQCLRTSERKGLRRPLHFREERSSHGMTAAGRTVLDASFIYLHGLREKQRADPAPFGRDHVALPAVPDVKDLLPGAE